MVTTPYALSEQAQEDVQATVRNIISGHPQGQVRRILLYLVVLLAFVVQYVAYDSFILSSGAILVGISALFVLAMSDQLA